jgi:transcriptional regulator with XRE-family HTH domain
LCSILQVMKNEILVPSFRKALITFGENIKLARLRRKLNAEQVAQRANISRKALWAVETGSPGVAIGTYAKVLFVMGLEKDFLKIAGDDTLGRKLHDAGLVQTFPDKWRMLN